VEQVTADDPEHALEVFHEDHTVNLWPENIEVTEVELLADKPDPPPSKFLRMSLKIDDVDERLVQGWLAKLAALDPENASCLRTFSVSRVLNGEGYNVWANLFREGDDE
jgi:hypothetical protein